MNNIQQKNKNEIAIRIEDVSKLYPGTMALKDVNIAVKYGEIYGIIGKNGAGKSTLVNIISGIVYPTTGRIIVGGNEYRGFSRIESKKEKVSVIMQEPQIVPSHTIVEALFSPNYIHRRGMINWRLMNKKTEEMLNSSLLNRIRGKRIMRDLSLSEQQLLLVYKAIFIEDANVLILDETTASLTTDDQYALYDFLEKLKQEGKAIIFISHRMEEILKVCDRVMVLRDGTLIDTVDKKNLDMEKLSRFIIGDKTGKEENLETQYTKIAENIDINESKESSFSQKDEEIMFELDGFTKEGYFKDINLKVKKGEVVGLAGLRGSGRTEILKGIIGIYQINYGTIKIKGDTKKFANPSEALKSGIVYLPEEREKEGLIQDLSIIDNITLSSLDKLCHARMPGIISKKRKITLTEDLIHDLSIKAVSYNQQVSDLSGGNKQKVVVSKILAVNPSVFLLDEPTRGIDIASKASILEIIDRGLRNNAAVIMTSPSLEDLMKICDRILVVYKGEIVKEYKKEDFKEDKIFLTMQGNINNKKDDDGLKKFLNKN